MRAVPEAKLPPVASGALTQIGEGLLDLPHTIWPEQIDIGSARRRLSDRLREAPKVERRTAARQGPQARRLDLERMELAAARDGLAIQQVAQDLHHLNRAPVARAGLERGAGQVARDDVHGEPAGEHLIEGRELPRQHRRPQLSAAHGHQQLHAGEQRCDASREGHRVDAEGVARGQ